MIIHKYLGLPDGAFDHQVKLVDVFFSQNNLTTVGFMKSLTSNIFTDNQIKFFVISPAAAMIDITNNLVESLNCTNVTLAIMLWVSLIVDIL